MVQPARIRHSRTLPI
jgi:hypothetical protein